MPATLTQHNFQTRLNMAENFFEGWPVHAWGENNEVGEWLTFLPGGDALHRSNLPSGNRVCKTTHLDRAAQVAASQMATKIVTIGRPAEGVFEVYAIG